ncbi:MAG: hypothetical protein KDE28_21500 [Anaerolineales bacterium]|nr:hypothetical protein [Anaerolineales bacterium]
MSRAYKWNAITPYLPSSRRGWFWSLAWLFGCGHLAWAGTKPRWNPLWEVDGNEFIYGYDWAGVAVALSLFSLQILVLARILGFAQSRSSSSLRIFGLLTVSAIWSGWLIISSLHANPVQIIHTYWSIAIVAGLVVSLSVNIYWASKLRKPVTHATKQSRAEPSGPKS